MQVLSLWPLSSVAVVITQTFTSPGNMYAEKIRLPSFTAASFNFLSPAPTQPPIPTLMPCKKLKGGNFRPFHFLHRSRRRNHASEIEKWFPHRNFPLFDVEMKPAPRSREPDVLPYSVNSNLIGSLFSLDSQIRTRLPGIT